MTKLEVTETGLVHHCSQYGVTLIIPEGAVEQTTTVWFSVCLISSQFRFADDSIPVSPIVWTHTNSHLIKPAELYIPHHIDVCSMKAPNNPLFLLTADDECFEREKTFLFKRNDKCQMNIESTLVKIVTSHFCCNCIATKGYMYREIPKKYLIAEAQKKEYNDLCVDICLLYQQPGCIKVSCTRGLNYLYPYV